MAKKTELKVEDVLKLMKEFVNYEEHGTLVFEDEFTLNGVEFKVWDAIGQGHAKLLYVHVKGNVNRKYKIHINYMREDVKIEAVVR